MNPGRRILVVEDVSSDAELACQELKKTLHACEFLRVETQEEYLEALDAFLPDLIVSDFRLPRFDGLTALKLAQERAPETPFIILTGSIDEDTAMECMKAGAWDYVTKGHIKRLGPAVLAAMRRRHLQEERTRVETALGKSEQRLKEAQRMGRIGHWEFDPGTQKIFWSDMVYEIYRRDPELGPPTVEEEASYYSPEDAKRLRECAVRTVETGEPYDMDVSVKLPDGRMLDIVATGSPVRDAAGRVARLLGTVQDVTERKNLQRQLVQAQKMEAIGRLAGGIAHDFNNLLSVVLANCDFVLDSLPDESSARRDVLEIQKAARRAAGLTKQLLAFSRRQVIEPRVVDVNEAVKNLGKMLGRLIGEHIDLRFDFAPDAGMVFMDPSQLEQIIMNLCVNSRDAMPRGGTLTIRTGRRTLPAEYVAGLEEVEPGEYVSVVVSDTGVGMTPEVKKRIFEPFFTTKGLGEGTGLGLSVVYGAVKQNKGHIEVESEPGKGAAFSILLKRLDRPEAGGTPATRRELPRGRGETVLVVEDEESLRRVVVRILAKAGYETLEAKDGAEALAVLRDAPQKPDLVLSDVVMPRLGGAELSARIKRDFPAIKVLFMSGYTDIPAAGHAGAPDVPVDIYKPVVEENLLAKVRKEMDK
jgi:signal transduction histidine kinase/DNA-binding response OmpR family regulator